MSSAKQPTRSCRQPAKPAWRAVHRSRADPDPFRHSPRSGSRSRSGPRTPAPARAATWNSKKTTPSGPGPIVEVLRATGIRVEELTELSHHSLVQYRLPTTGEIVPLLQIVTIQDRCRAAAGGHPGTGRRAQHGHPPRPRAPAAPSRWSPPTTTTNAYGCHHCRCCSNAALGARASQRSAPRRHSLHARRRHRRAPA